MLSETGPPQSIWSYCHVCRDPVSIENFIQKIYIAKFMNPSEV
jgi:hypothetical protein